ncbi:DUF1028 domain-containing protein [Lichenifustis flavocetrariae]|uniref:DUF1028 domain-containing protein n=1 Tax=Lichenifustis flavocetrariae TaxID=2949735 RepID=A0AA41YWS3_9HYPH|nr:DUF1028 domain-containing protein [Lichenifustis flavocetrariae]MCW6508413.1 DUF1028 domain-containing protein [Lichenifustis flavocetrariae]
MTFSIVARCAETGWFGMAVASSSPAVAARCAHARAGVGAVASQNITDPALGPRVLDLMALGASAEQAIAALRGSTEHMDYRQVLAVDNRGRTATHSGPRALGVWASAEGENVACGGNLLADPQVPAAMVESFEASQGHLGDRLLLAMRAGLARGGEAGPIHSAGLKLVDAVSWPVADLRVDWTQDCPIAGVEALWALYQPQLDAYVIRALHPTGAPSYGVPGDL